MQTRQVDNVTFNSKEDFPVHAKGEGNTVRKLVKQIIMLGGCPITTRNNLQSIVTEARHMFFNKA